MNTTLDDLINGGYIDSRDYHTGDMSRHHVDHVYPQTVFTRAKVRELGLSNDKSAWILSAVQEIPNLQLLTPAENESKGGRLPASWLAAAFPDDTDRAAVRAFHHFGEVSDSLDEFEDFFLARREKLAAVIRIRLGIATQTP